MYGWLIVWPWPIGGGLVGERLAGGSSGKNYSRGTARSASSTRSSRMPAVETCCRIIRSSGDLVFQSLSHSESIPWQIRRGNVSATGHRTVPKVLTTRTNGADSAGVLMTRPDRSIIERTARNPHVTRSSPAVT